VKDKLMTHEKKYQNHLAHEKSPYLLQHADNPVDWYPWSEEAFQKAQRENRPIFLSIGYSTCHWCHVMEHESFEDPETAKLLNDYFVAIKVDREERPDIDNIYMTAVMAMTGQGGWPLNIFLTPDKKPFFGGTYFPLEKKWGQPGLKEILFSIHKLWQEDQQKILQSSQELVQQLKQQRTTADITPEQEIFNKEIFDSAFEQYSRSFDSRFGGFGSAPKFPSSHNLSFLLRYWKRTGNADALKMVEQTLAQMAQGGMYDHLGGGFHRYSTDPQWQIPHFEKMLYDQAMLARIYLEAYQITHNEFYAQIAREIFEYVLRDMTDPQGGFYSAEDADSLDPQESQGLKKEGAFYLWRYDEIQNILGNKDSKIFTDYFGIKPDGNALSDPHGDFIGKNIIFAAQAANATQAVKVNPDIEQKLKNAKEKLFAVRQRRPRPHLDDKILVDWNGLMISSLAFGSRVLNEPRYLRAAEKSAQFIFRKLIDTHGRLLHRYRDGDAAIHGTIEDYAFFIHGLLDLYEATFDASYLKHAVQLSEDMVKLFGDNKSGFFFVGKDAEQLLYPQKEIYDGAIPSGNSIAALDLVRLFHDTLNTKWEEEFRGLFQHFSHTIVDHPTGYAQALIAVDFAIGASQEIVIAGEPQDKNVQEIVKKIYGKFLPNKIIILRSEESTKELMTISPFIETQRPIDGKTTIYVCENHMCQRPIQGLSELDALLEKL